MKQKCLVPALNKQDYLRYGKTHYEQVIIFDEAQRAWDAERMSGPLSESDVIIHMAKANKPRCVVIGFIGDGQETNVGVENGLLL